MSLVQLRRTLELRLFGLWKIPLIAWLRPVVHEQNEERCEIRFPLRRRSMNHLRSMYFGALCVGADLAAGAIAMRTIQARAPSVVFVFKDFQARFLKRAEGDVVFSCEEGAKLRGLVEQADRSGERVEETVRVVARVPSKLGDEPVAEFDLTISLKKRRPKA